jgi:3-hydroxyisobutyrate dehydrogenase-like beta-hydroxyacid dehydrogenase
MPENIGFVGVGRMGANMARRLKEVGYPITAVFDVRKDVAQQLATEVGAEPCEKLSRVTAQSEVIITVVTDDQATRGIFSGKSDNLLQDAAGRVFVNCATITPAVHVEMEQLAREAGAETLEACMASSITQARNGLLYLMIGGAPETFEKLKPLLEKLSASMRYVGSAGKAAEVKALVNMVMNINTAGLAEGLGLGAALNLDLAMLREVFSQTGADSRVLETDGEDMQNREHSCYFSAEHAAKDSGIALSLARKQNLDLPLATATFEQYSRITRLGLGGLDKSGIAELTFTDRTSSRPSPKTGRAMETRAEKTGPKTAGPRKATAKRPAGKKPTEKISSAKKPAAKKGAPKKRPAKKGLAKKPVGNRGAVKTRARKKSVAKAAGGKKSSAKRAAAKKGKKRTMKKPGARRRR